MVGECARQWRRGRKEWQKCVREWVRERESERARESPQTVSSHQVNQLRKKKILILPPHNLLFEYSSSQLSAFRCRPLSYPATLLHAATHCYTLLHCRLQSTEVPSTMFGLTLVFGTAVNRIHALFGSRYLNMLRFIWQFRFNLLLISKAAEVRLCCRVLMQYAVNVM